MKHNGWSNYETWRINLEWFDNPVEFVEYDKNMLQEYVTERLYEEDFVDVNSKALSYAVAFISNVDWYEIQESIQREYRCNGCDEITEDEYCSKDCKDSAENMYGYEKA